MKTNIIIALLSIICGFLGYIAANLNHETKQSVKSAQTQAKIQPKQTAPNPTLEPINKNQFNPEEIINGGMIRKTAKYPNDAEGEEGIVIYEIQVNQTGKTNPSSLKLIQSSGSRLLDKAARRAVLVENYTPQTKNGIPMRTRYLIAYDFRQP